MLHRLRRIQQRLEERKKNSVTEFYGSDDDEDEVCKSEGNNWRKMETAWTGGGGLSLPFPFKPKGFSLHLVCLLPTKMILPKMLMPSCCLLPKCVFRRSLLS